MAPTRTGAPLSKGPMVCLYCTYGHFHIRCTRGNMEILQPYSIMIGCIYTAQCMCELYKDASYTWHQTNRRSADCRETWGLYIFIVYINPVQEGPQDGRHCHTLKCVHMNCFVSWGGRFCRGLCGFEAFYFPDSSYHCCKRTGAFIFYRLAVSCLIAIFNSSADKTIFFCFYLFIFLRVKNNFLPSRSLRLQTWNKIDLKKKQQKKEK